MIARLAWKYVPSDENNAVFGRVQSFVTGAPTNLEFMVKDTNKYAATAGWGFAQFTDGKPDSEGVARNMLLLSRARERERLSLCALRLSLS